jgi:hypothetical protein
LLTESLNKLFDVVADFPMQEMVAQYKAQSSQPKHDEVDIDDLMDVCFLRSRLCFALLHTNFSPRYSHLVLLWSSLRFLGYAFLLEQDPELEKLHAERIAAMKVWPLHLLKLLFLA